MPKSVTIPDRSPENGGETQPGNLIALPIIIVVAEERSFLQKLLLNLRNNSASNYNIALPRELAGLAAGGIAADERSMADILSADNTFDPSTGRLVVPVLLQDISSLPWKNSALRNKGSAEFVFVCRQDARDAAVAAQLNGWADARGKLPVSVDWPGLRSKLAEVCEKRVLLEELLAARGHPFLTIYTGSAGAEPQHKGRSLTEGLADVLAPATRQAQNDSVDQDDAVARLSSLFKGAMDAFRRPSIKEQANVPAGDNAQKIAAVLMVKDEEDIIFINLCWHHAQGLRRFVILDNGSSDGTRAEIARFIRLAEPLGTKVFVLDDREVAYYQSHKTSVGAQIATDYFGTEWAFAIDADEFWHCASGSIPDAVFRAEKFMEGLVGFRRNEAGFQVALRVPFHNYYCTEKDIAGEPNPTVRQAYRDVKPKGYKTAVRWTSGNLFGQGNHVVASGAGALTPTLNGARFGLGMRHYARRSFVQFLKKATNGGVAYEASALALKFGTHWRNWYKLVQDGDGGNLKQEFEKEFVRNSGDLKFDPLPRLDISEEGISVGKPPAAMFDLPLNATPLVEVRGTAFQPTAITLSAEPAPAPVELRLGTSDVPTFFQVFVRKDYEFDLGFTPKYVIDLGANIGLAAAYFSGRYPGCHIFCVEPNRSNFELLERNIAALNTVNAICGAAWFETSVLEIVDTDERGQDLGFWGTQTKVGQPQNSHKATPAWSIADLQSKAGFPWIDVLKVDIEGAELELFANNSDIWLERTNCVIVETHDRFRPGSLGAVQTALQRHPFEQTQSGENLVFRRTSQMIGT